MHGHRAHVSGHGAVDVGAPEQFLLHLASQRGADASVGAIVGERLVEPLRGDRQLVCRVQNMPGAPEDTRTCKEPARSRMLPRGRAASLLVMGRAYDKFVDRFVDRAATADLKKTCFRW
jgi:hypothetical protein